MTYVCVQLWGTVIFVIFEKSLTTSVYERFFPGVNE